MWRKFRWDMFVTSFLPLWGSIIIVDIWSIIENAINIWNCKLKFENNLLALILKCKLQFASITVIIIVILVSTLGILSFLKARNASKSNPKGKIITAIKANKLSSEFLLAYILPMIAFDFTDIKDVVLFIVYFSVLAFLCIRNNNVYTNILMEFKGYKMYKCSIECKRAGKDYLYDDSLIISRQDLTQQKENHIYYWDFDNCIYIALDGGKTE